MNTLIHTATNVGNRIWAVILNRDANDGGHGTGYCAVKVWAARTSARCYGPFIFWTCRYTNLMDEPYGRDHYDQRQGEIR